MFKAEEKHLIIKREKEWKKNCEKSDPSLNGT
jgi:hypothetical protein